MRKRYRGWFLMINFLLGVTRLEDLAVYWWAEANTHPLQRHWENWRSASGRFTLSLSEFYSFLQCSRFFVHQISSLRFSEVPSHCIPFLPVSFLFSNTISRLDVDPAGYDLLSRLSGVGCYHPLRYRRDSAGPPAVRPLRTHRDVAE